MNQFIKGKKKLSFSPTSSPVFPHLLFPIFHLLSLLRGLAIDAGMLCAGMCAFPICVCISPLWPPLICQGVLVRVAVSSIHICASAQRLNICHRAKSDSECKTQEVFCVGSWTLNNNLKLKHRCYVVLVVIFPRYLAPSQLVHMCLSFKHRALKKKAEFKTVSSKIS